MSGSFVYAPFVPLQSTTIHIGDEDRTGQLWGGDDRELLVVDSWCVNAGGSFWAHSVINLLTEASAPTSYSESELVRYFKRRG